MPPFSPDQRPLNTFGSKDEAPIDAQLTEQNNTVPAEPNRLSLDLLNSTGLPTEPGPGTAQGSTIPSGEQIVSTTGGASSEAMQNHFDMNGSATFSRGADGNVSASYVAQEGNQLVTKTELVPHLNDNPNIPKAEALPTAPATPEALSPQEKGISAWNSLKQRVGGLGSKISGLKDRVTGFVSKLGQGALRTADSVVGSVVVTGYEAAAGVSRAVKFAGEKAVALQEGASALFRKTEGLVGSAVDTCKDRIDKSKASIQEWNESRKFMQQISPLYAELHSMLESQAQQSSAAELAHAEELEKERAIIAIENKYDLIRRERAALNTGIASTRDRINTLLQKRNAPPQPPQTVAQAA